MTVAAKARGPVLLLFLIAAAVITVVALRACMRANPPPDEPAPFLKR